MYLLIRYPGGIIAEGAALAKGRDRLRVVVAGFPDTVELRRAGAIWSTCRGEVVEFDFLMSNERWAQTLPSSDAKCIAAAERHGCS